nr:hypothetical protein [Tanacetum cinerariifolium]
WGGETELKELMELSTKLFDRVLDLEKIKTAQAKEIADLKKRVNKLERKRRFRTPGMNLFKIGTSRRRSLSEEDASKQGRKLKQRRGLLGLKDLLVLLKLLLLVMVSTAAKVNAASEYDYYCLKSMFEEKLQLLVNANINEVIINGDSPVLEPPVVGTVLPLKTEAQKLAKKNELKAKSTLLLAILDEHLLKFHSFKDAKSLWEAIKIRYMRLRLKGNQDQAPNSHNVAFVSSKNTSSINETVTAAHDIPDIGSKEQSSALSYADDVMFSFFASGHDYNEGKEIYEKNREKFKLQWQEAVGFDKTKVECYNCHIREHFARECHAPRNHGNRNADNERRVVPVETPASALVVQDGLGGYEWSYQAEEAPTDFALMAHSLDSANSSNSEGTMKEKDDFKEKLTKFKESFKKLTKLTNSQMSANDKTGLGYDSQLSENEMPKCEIFETASDSSVGEIVEDNNEAKDMYKVGIRYHVVPPPYTGNYMPPRADLSFAGLDDSVFKFKISETRTSVNENELIASKSSEEIKEEPKIVRSSFPIIEDWKSDSKDMRKDKTSTEQEISSNDNPVKSVECTNKYIFEKPTNNHDENLRKRQDSRVDWNGMKTQKQGIGFEFNKKACFVCGSVNHLIKDCTFYDNKMVENMWLIIKQLQLSQDKCWVNAAKQNSAASTSTARPKVNTAAIRPNVNAKSCYFKSHFHKRRHFNQRSVAKPNTFSRKINTAKGKNVTTVGPKAVVNVAKGKKENVVKSSACWIWKPTGKLIDHTSKDSYDKVNKDNDQEQIQALVDKTKVIIADECIRSDLRFDDAEGTACLLNEEIFKGLARMGKQRKETETSHDELEDEDHVPTPSSNPLSSGDDSSILNEFMVFYTNLQEQGRINDDEMFRVDDLAREKVVVETTTGIKDSAAPTTNDKGKAKMIEPELPLKKKEHMKIDEEYVRKLQGKEQEAARLSRAQQDEEANNSWDNIQAMMDADRLLTERLQAREREESLRSFDKIKELLDREMTKVNNFIDMDSEAQESSTKKTEEHLESEISMKQKVDENVKSAINDSEELRKYIEIVPNDVDEVLIKATPISSRSPTSIDYKIHKEGKKNYFKIIRADGNSQVYQTFKKIFKNFNREDLEVLWAIVKDRFKKEKPVDDIDNVLFRTLKTMFKHHVEDTIWKYQQGLAKVKN